MDQLFEFAALAVFLWRAVLCAAAGALMAFLVNLLYPALPSAAWFALVFIGASVGIVWQAGIVSARETAKGRKAQLISKPVAFLALGLIGGVWGGLVSAAAGTAVALVTLVAAPCILGPLFGHIARERVAPSSIIFSITASVVGFSVPYAVHLLLSA